MNSYFFIPANRLEFLKKHSSISCTSIVVDLEDAIETDKLSESIKNILDVRMPLNTIFRPNVKKQEFINSLKILVEHGYLHFLIPKIETSEMLNQIIQDFQSWNPQLNFQFDILIESPLALNNIGSIISHPMVKRVGFGSHDYCNTICMKHSLENIYWARMALLNSAKALKKEVIDIASMNIKNKECFKMECLDGYEKGFDAKFIIHPWQLDIFNSLNLYSSSEINLAMKVKVHLEEIGGRDRFTILNLDGQVIEKPHLNRLNKILKETNNGSF